MTKRLVGVGGVTLGGGRVAVQSMTTVRTSDVENCVAQILALEEAGCKEGDTVVVGEVEFEYV